MAKFTNSIAIAKTKKSFLEQANKLSRHFGEYDVQGDTFLFDLDNEDTLLLKQEIKDSFFSKIYRMECVANIRNISELEDFGCKLELKGMINTKGSLVKSWGDSQFVNSFNKSKNLVDLNILLKKVQIEFMEIKYSSDEKKLKIKIIPYAGSMIWMIIPPIAYQVKIWDEELKAISEIINLLYNYTKKFRNSGV
jgi:hypothetical protein